MPLSSPRFAGDSVLEACLNGAARLAISSTGPAVGKVQQALVDSGFPLPLKGVDEKFGPETAGAVNKFQQNNRLRVDGIVGRKTMEALDAAFPAPGGGGGGRLLAFKIPTGGMGGNLAPGLHWGVDSVAPADTSFTVGKSKTKTTLFDLVVSELGTVPEFWGRYLFSGKKKGIKAVTTQEVAFISKKSGGKCRILLVANFVDSQLAQGRATGQSNASMSIAAASKLGAPKGVWIYIDVEPGVQCNANWFVGWFETMLKAGRGQGGVYEVAKDPRFHKPYRAALKETLDIFQKALNPDPKVFLPDLPQQARLLWAQRPLAIPTPSLLGVDSAGVVPASSIGFKADDPGIPTYLTGMTVLWQYAIKFLLIPNNLNSQIDMNLAKTQGLLSMFKP